MEMNKVASVDNFWPKEFSNVDEIREYYHGRMTKGSY